MHAPDYSDTPWKPWSTCQIGTAHQREMSNCQDAVCVREGSYMRPRTLVAQGRAIVAAVSDGVGSHRYAEVGARVTATLAANITTDALLKGARPAALEARLNRELPRELRKLADVCRDEWTECCYATLVLAVGTRDWFAVWACGDGYAAVNADRPVITGVTTRDRLPVDYGFQPEGPRPPMLTKLFELKASEVRGAWISTDGARYLTNSGKAWRDYLDDPLDMAPPVLAGWQGMESWGSGLHYEARAGNSRLRDDLGLVAFVPREETGR